MATRSLNKRLVPAGWSWPWLLLAVVGCSTSTSIPRDRLLPGQTLSHVRVSMRSGVQYTFESALVRPDTLVGQYTVSVEHESPRDGTYYQNEPRTYAIALDSIDSLSVVRRDVGKTVLCGAGVAVVTVFLHNLADTKTGAPNSDGGAVIKQDPSGHSRQ
jgi:hypothetical protein